MKLPRFTLRDLFWLVLVVALVLGWWLNARQQAWENRKLQFQVDAIKSEVEQKGFQVTISDDGSGVGVNRKP